ncbi:hypothetical protein SALBM311S_08547 [Streptomyces alboniger]
MTTRGVLYVHSAPRALCPHVEWAIAGVLGTRVNLDWIRQPAAPGTWRSEFSWQAEVGTASKLASALRGWHLLRFEVTAEPCATAEGERYSCTPELGIFHAVTGIHGDILIPEDRLRAALTRARARRDGPGGGDRQTAGQALGRRTGALQVRGRGRAREVAPPGRLEQVVPEQVVRSNGK